MFTVLPFGLSLTGYIFTKVVRPLVAHLRKDGIKVTVYLDDGLGLILVAPLGIIFVIYTFNRLCLLDCLLGHWTVYLWVAGLIVNSSCTLSLD